MSYLKAKQHLEKYNLGDRIIEFSSSTATVALAAENAGVEVSEPESRPTIIAVKPSDVSIEAP